MTLEIFMLSLMHHLDRVMSVFSYYTIEGPMEGMYKEKGSKFLAFAYPVETEEAIKTYLESLRKQFFDARHHCYAWMLGAEKKSFRAFDDGEPNHSAGDPILGQIRSKDLTNILIVVVRYFGGVKLGVGGLISAYRAAAEDALSNATIVEKEVSEEFLVSFEYASTPEVMRLIKDYDLQVIHQDFTSRCVMRLAVKLKNKSRLVDKIKLMNALGTLLDVQF